MTQHRVYLQQAVALAAENVSSGKGGPYAAIIVQDQQILAACGNQVTHTHDPTAHAEIMAIRTACQVLGHFQLQDSILYSSCEPCPMCLGAIYWARLSAVYFACDREDAAQAGFDDQFIYTEIQVAPADRKIPMHQIQLVNPLQPFMLWNRMQHKIAY